MASVPYQSKFQKGELVRVKSSEDLERFRLEWKFHDPLTVEQVAQGGRTDHVKEVGYYFGGDVLYTLDNIPGVWHEENLSEP
jgi:hypothetical protein